MVAFQTIADLTAAGHAQSFLNRHEADFHQFGRLAVGFAKLHTGR